MSERVIDIPLMAQELSLWCWAAIASALSAVYSSDPKAPCVIASLIKGESCCQDATPCNSTEELHLALEYVGIPAQQFGRLNFQEVRASIIERARPMGARIVKREDGVAHFVLIVGCDPVTQSVVCADPLGSVGLPAPRYRMDYQKFLKDYGGWGDCSHMYLLT